MLRPIMVIWPTFISINVQTVGRAMIVNLWNKPGTAVEVLENSALHRLGGRIFKEKFG